MRLITKKMQERGILRLRRSDVNFLYVRTTYNAIRHRRGTFYFQTIIKFFDEEEELRKYRVIVTFQPDVSAYFLHNIFITAEEDRAEALKQTLYEARENQARNKLSDIGLLDTDKMQSITNRFINCVNSIETWGENKNGYPFKRLEGFGRYVMNIESAII
jgi:hypothetical protein